MKVRAEPETFQSAPIVDGRVACLLRGESIDLETCLTCPSLQRFVNSDEPRVVCRDHVRRVAAPSSPAV